MKRLPRLPLAAGTSTQVLQICSEISSLVTIMNNNYTKKEKINKSINMTRNNITAWKSKNNNNNTIWRLVNCSYDLGIGVRVSRYYYLVKNNWRRVMIQIICLLLVNSFKGNIISFIIQAEIGMVLMELAHPSEVHWNNTDLCRKPNIPVRW